MVLENNGHLEQILGKFYHLWPDERGESRREPNADESDG